MLGVANMSTLNGPQRSLIHRNVNRSKDHSVGEVELRERRSACRLWLPLIHLAEREKCFSTLIS